jgi:hypothetical protein
VAATSVVAGSVAGGSVDGADESPPPQATAADNATPITRMLVKERMRVLFTGSSCQPRTDSSAMAVVERLPSITCL